MLVFGCMISSKCFSLFQKSLSVTLWRNLLGVERLNLEPYSMPLVLNFFRPWISIPKDISLGSLVCATYKNATIVRTNNNAMGTQIFFGYPLRTAVLNSTPYLTPYLKPYLPTPKSFVSNSRLSNLQLPSGR